MPTPRRWQCVEPTPPLRDRIAEALALDPIVAQVLVTRGYRTPEDARLFLEAPAERLTDPDLIIDMPRAAERIMHAIRGGEPITVYGDYDADGVSATSLLLRGFAAVGGKVDFYIPSRAREGYGINDAALATIASRGGGVVVSVDCGVTAVSEADAAVRRGQDLIIVDHHEPPSVLPRAVAVVDPKRADHAGPFREYCAAGLAFQLLRAVRRRLGVPDDFDFVDLAALGTIADVVPLVHDNRILVRAGLARMSAAPTLGLASLMRVIGLEGEITARHVGYSLGPRINAAGRLGDATAAVRLLTTDDGKEAEAIAQQLDAENERRQAVCDRIEAEAIEQVEAGKLWEQPAIVLADPRWHPGVIGIVASRLVERYYRPAIMIAIESGIGKGSARSIDGFQLVDALMSCASLLVRAGGHAMAAGLTVSEERIPEFSRCFVEVARKRLSREQLIPVVPIDAEIDLSVVTDALARQLAQLAPFGAGNREPILCARGLHAVSTRLLGDGVHLRLGLSDGRGYAEAIGFHLGDVSDLLAFTQATLDLAFSVTLDRWGDRERVQLVVRDLQTPGIDLEAVLSDRRVLIDRLFVRAQDYLSAGILGIEDAGAFYTKVVGVSFEGRQDQIRTLEPGHRLRLHREPHNAHDPHAIKVLTDAGEQIGYLSAKLAARLAPSVDSGTRYAVSISDITGGGEDRHLGVNIYIQRQDLSPNGGDEGQLLRKAWQELAHDALVDRVRTHLHCGRPYRGPQHAVVRAIAEGQSVLGVFGPGRGRQMMIEAAAATTVIAGRGPVVIAVPLRSQVDWWQDRVAPRLRRLGIRCVCAHGALFFRQRQQVLQALSDGEVDVLIGSVEYLRQHGMTPPPALLLIDSEPTIDGKVLAELRRKLGHPRLAVFVAGTEPETSGTVEREEHLVRIGDTYLRTNLRLIDRREPAEYVQALEELVAGDERVLISVATRSASVEVAFALRAQTDRMVAYYHDGLPLRVREVLEQMFADGKIDILVAAGFSEDAAPHDLHATIVAGLPGSRAALREQFGLVGRDGKPATVTLLYRRSDLELLNSEQAERNPSRETLATFYRELRAFSTRGGELRWPDDDVTATLQGVGISRRTIGIGLDILAEAGVLHREYDGERWRITLPADVPKRDLTVSLRYSEGRREAEAVAEVEQWAFGPLTELLRTVAGPTARANTLGPARA